MPFLDGKPVIITKRNVDKFGNPISVKQIETKQVVDIHNTIPLNYSIDRNYPIYIDGLYQIYNQDEISNDTFFADYDQGILYFHPSKVGKSLTITYMGTGYILISSDRIYRYNSMNGANTNETIEASFEKLENLMNTIIKNGGNIGSIDAEVIASRTDVYGDTFISLGDRLNQMDVQLNNLTMMVKYKRVETINTDGNTVCIGINEFNPKRDILNVYLSGVKMIEDIDYSIDNDTGIITNLKGNWVVGDQIYFEVYQRMVDGNMLHYNPTNGTNSIDAQNINVTPPVLGKDNVQEALIEMELILKNFPNSKNYVIKTGDTMTGNLIMGNNSKVIGDLEGNSDTTTKLKTPRNINGVEFDGTKDITIFDNTKETPIDAQAKADKALQDAKLYTDTKVADLVNSAPNTLDTLKELSDALGNDANFSTNVLNKINEKANTADLDSKADKNYVDTELLKKADVNHKHKSSEIIDMDGYTKATSLDAIVPNDTLNQAIGKLEKGLEEKSNKLHNHDSNYLKLTGGTVNGNITISGSNKIIGDVQGNSDTTTKLKTPRTIKVGNSVAKPFDGTQDLVFTLNEIGASTGGSGNSSGQGSTVVTGNYLPLSGGTMTGDITMSANSKIVGDLDGNSSSTTKLKNARTFKIGNSSAKSFDGTGDISFTLNEIGVNLDSYLPLVGGTVSGNITIDGANKIIGNLEGNSSTATRLETSRTIQVGNSSAKAFDGTNNLTFSLNEIGVDGNYLPLLGGTMVGDITMNNSSKFIGDLQGNSDTTTKFKTPRTIKIGNSKAKPFDGTSNIYFTLDEIGATGGQGGTVVTGNYLPLSGGIMTGDITMDNGFKVIGDVQGNSDTTTKLKSARTIQVGSSSAKPFDGTKNISFTLNEIGVNLDSYLSLSGGNMSGDITMTGGSKVIGDLDGNSASTTKLKTARTIKVGSSSAKPFDGTGDLVFELDEIGIKTGDYLPLDGGSMTGDINMTGSSKLVGNVKGNSDTTTKLKTPVDITIGNETESFDGTTSISFDLDQIGVSTKDHTHTTEKINALTGYVKGNFQAPIFPTDSLNVALAKLENSIGKGGSGSAGSGGGTTITGNYLPLAGGMMNGDIIMSTNTKVVGNLQGNSDTASKLKTPISIQLTGDITGTATKFDGSSNAIIKSTLSNVSRSNTTSTDSPNFGTTFTAIDGVVTDTKGRVTSVNTKTITLPTPAPIIDTKVTNTLDTTTKAYITGTTSNVTNTGTQIFDTGVYLDTTAGTLTATTFKGNLNGNATTATTAINCSGNSATSTKATQDSIGQQINTTYIKGLSVSGKTITYTKGDGSTGTITTQDTDTHYTAKNIVGATNTSTSNSTSSNDSTYINLIENGVVRSSNKISGSGATVVSSDSNGNITISSTDTNTTYNAGTGIVLNGTTFNHKNSITAGTAQGEASKTLSWGGTFTIPTVTYDAQGHITGKGSTTMTMPSNPNSDTKVTNALNTKSKAYITGTTSNVTNTGTQIFDTGVYLDTTEGHLTATQFNGSLNGNAATATKLQNARDIQLTGDITGIASFDGSSNAIIKSTLSNVSRSNTTSTDSPNFGTTFTAIDSITTDNKGRLTGVNTKTITLPNAPSRATDENVTNTLSNTSIAYVTGTTSNKTNTGKQVFNTGVYLNTTVGHLNAVQFNGNLNGNANTSTKLQNARSITINGAVSGVASFDGSQNITISTSNNIKVNIQKIRTKVQLTKSQTSISIGTTLQANDIVDVFLSGVKLEEGTHYTLNRGNSTISSIKNTTEFLADDYFNFEVLRATATV